MHRAGVALAAILMLTIGVALAAGQGDSSRQAPRPASHPNGAPVLVPDVGGAIEAQARLTAIIGWADAMHGNEVAVAVLVARPVPVELAPAVPAAPSVPQPVRSGSGCGFDLLIRSVFGPAGDWAVSIALRESGCDPSAYNASGASGLFQLLGHQDLVNQVCPGGSVFDPRCNTLAAKVLYDSSGTAPWAL